MKLLPASLMAVLSHALFLSPEQTSAFASVASATVQAAAQSQSPQSQHQDQDNQRSLLASSPWKQLGTTISMNTPPNGSNELADMNDLIGLGYALSTSSNGKILAVGAPYAKHNAGKVKVYSYDETLQLWVQLGSEIGGDYYGYYLGYDLALSYSGKVLVVGAPRTLDGRGLVKVYRYDDYSAEWEQIGNDIEGIHPMEEFGTSVATSEDGNLIVVGAPRASSRPGAVRIYEFAGVNGNGRGDDPTTTPGGGGGSTWVQVGSDILGESENDRAGHAVDILTHSDSDSGTTYVAVGALMDLYTEGSVAVYKYSRADQNWVQHGSRVDGDEFGTEFGRSVCLGHDGKDLILAVGFPGPGVNEESKVKSGAQVYNINDDGYWDFYGQMIFPLEEDDNTGYKVSLSSDGQTLAVSSPNYGNVGEGFVQVYYKGMDSDEYKRVGHGIMGDESDELGYAISVSRDGKIIAASTPDAQYVSSFVIGSENDLSHLSPNSMSATAIASLTFFIVCAIALLSFGTFKAIIYVKNKRDGNYAYTHGQSSTGRGRGRGRGLSLRGMGGSRTRGGGGVGGVGATGGGTSFTSVPLSNNEYEIRQISTLPTSPQHVIGEPDSDDEDGSEVSYDEDDDYESHLTRVTPDII